VILAQDLGQIAQAQVPHAVGGRRRPLFDQDPEKLELVGVQARTSPTGLAVDQPARAIGVEGHAPITHRLQPEPADLGRLRAHSTRGDHRQSSRSELHERLRQAQIPPLFTTPTAFWCALTFAPSRNTMPTVVGTGPADDPKGRVREHLRHPGIRTPILRKRAPCGPVPVAPENG